MAVDRTILGKAHRQIAIALVTRRINLVMVRAVHGLEVVFSTFIGHRWIHSFFVVWQMTARNVE